MSRRADGSWRYDDPAWRRVRLQVLARDGRVCQLRGQGCTVDATQVDHIVRPDDGGALFDPDNLRASCRHCNASRGGKAAQADGRSVAGRFACPDGDTDAHLTPAAACPTCGYLPSRRWLPATA